MTEPRTLLLEAYLKRLKLPAMKRHYRSLAREAAEQNRTFEEYLLALVEQEVLQRDDNQLRARLKLAGFPVPHTLDSFAFSQAGAELLWQFMAARYQRGSVAITTNLDFREWPKVFGDEKMTAALLDRLTHRAHILAMNGDSYRFNGDSYRFKESLRRQQAANE